jgi:hypothetical protein
MSSKIKSGLVEKVRQLYVEVLQKSEQPIFIQINDSEKICNEKFVKFLEYETIQEFENDDKKFPKDYVSEGTFDEFMTAYREAREHYASYKSEIGWKKPSGAIVKTDMISVPFPFEGKILVFNYLLTIYQSYK